MFKKMLPTLALLIALISISSVVAIARVVMLPSDNTSGVLGGGYHILFSRSGSYATMADVDDGDCLRLTAGSAIDCKVGTDNIHQAALTINNTAYISTVVCVAINDLDVELTSGSYYRLGLYQIRGSDTVGSGASAFSKVQIGGDIEFNQSNSSKEPIVVNVNSWTTSGYNMIAIGGVSSNDASGAPGPNSTNAIFVDCSVLGNF